MTVNDYLIARDNLVQRYRDGELIKPQKCIHCPFCELNIKENIIYVCSAGVRLLNVTYKNETRPDICPLDQKKEIE